jgi:hypothetical protein
VVGETIKVSGNPLDFSFLGLKKVEQLKKEEARSGKRRPIQNSDDEEEKKVGGVEQIQIPNPGEVAEVEGKKEHKEIVIRANYVPEIAQVLTTPTSTSPPREGRSGPAGRPTTPKWRTRRSARSLSSAPLCSSTTTKLGRLTTSPQSSRVSCTILNSCSGWTFPTTTSSRLVMRFPS